MGKVAILNGTLLICLVRGFVLFGMVFMMSQSDLGMADTVTWNRSAGEIARAVAWTLLVLMVTAAVVLAWRRLTGRLHRPLETTTISVAAAILVFLAAVIRRFWRIAVPRRIDVLLMAVVTASLVAVGLALCVRHTPTGGLVAFWIFLGVGEGLAWRRLLWRGAGSKTLRPKRLDVSHAPPRPHSPHLPPAAQKTLPAENVTQQMLRHHETDGSEILSGWVRVGLEPGQRTASVHLAFCPPFTHTPTLVVNPPTSPIGRVKTVQLLPYGARFDLKLARPFLEPTAVLLEFVAMATPSSDMRVNIQEKGCGKR